MSELLVTLTIPHNPHNPHTLLIIHIHNVYNSYTATYNTCIIAVMIRTMYIMYSGSTVTTVLNIHVLIPIMLIIRAFIVIILIKYQQFTIYITLVFIELQNSYVIVFVYVK